MKSPTDQYEILTEDLDELTKRIRGIRCRWCSWEIQMEGLNKVFESVPLIQTIVPAMIATFYSYGHALTCQAPRGN